MYSVCTGEIMTIAQLWKSGNSLVVTIPDQERKFYELKKGDFIDITISKLDKKEDISVTDKNRTLNEKGNHVTTEDTTEEIVM